MPGYSIYVVIQCVEISALLLHPSINIGMPVEYPGAVIIAFCLEYERSIAVNDH